MCFSHTCFAVAADLINLPAMEEVIYLIHILIKENEL